MRNSLNKLSLLQKKHCCFQGLIPIFSDRYGYAFGYAKCSQQAFNWARSHFNKPRFYPLDMRVFLTRLKALKDESGLSILDEVILEAVQRNVSDIHFFRKKSGYHIYFRQQKDLMFFTSFSEKDSDYVLSLIKFECNSDLGIKKKPIQARLSLSHLGLASSLRASIIPSYFSQDIVLRLHTNQKYFSSIEDLTLSSEKQQCLKQALSCDSGLILVTGPTGSGKTTSLYTFATYLAKQRQCVIVSIEDPIECYLEEIRQSQINPEAGYDYKEGLKAVLRQDPDVILVGEIRDAQTAAIAFQAAFTGHLVLSTCHTKDVWTSFLRFKQLGVDPIFLKHAFVGIFSQRLTYHSRLGSLNMQAAFFKSGLNDEALNSKDAFLKQVEFLDWDQD